MSILITGATGFIGSHILSRLIKEKYQVIVLKRSVSNTWRIESLFDKVKKYDIDKTSLSQIFKENKISIIVHLATLYRKYDDGEEIKNMITANITFPLELLELATKHGVKGFINTGSFFEYDCSHQPINEKAKDRPFNFYAKTKLGFEALLSHYSTKLSIITFKIFSPYGEMDNIKLISSVIQHALNNTLVELSDGKQKLDFIYVKDIVSAYIKGIQYIEKSENIGEYKRFNLGSGKEHSIREVVMVIERILGKVIKKKWGQPSFYDLPIACADISLIKKELNWEPKFSIQKGIKKTICYCQHSGK